MKRLTLILTACLLSACETRTVTLGHGKDQHKVYLRSAYVGTWLENTPFFVPVPVAHFQDYWADK